MYLLLETCEDNNRLSFQETRLYQTYHVFVFFMLWRISFFPIPSLSLIQTFWDVAVSDRGIQYVRLTCILKVSAQGLRDCWSNQCLSHQSSSRWQRRHSNVSSRGAQSVKISALLLRKFACVYKKGAQETTIHKAVMPTHCSGLTSFQPWNYYHSSVTGSHCFIQSSIKHCLEPQQVTALSWH